MRRLNFGSVPMLEVLESHRATGNLVGNVPDPFHLFSESHILSGDCGCRYGQSYVLSEDTLKSDLRSQGDPMFKLRHHRFLLIVHPGGIPQEMESILSLIESGVTGLTLTLKSEDLKEFAHLLIEKAKEQLLPVMVSASHEDLLTKKEVLDKFNVCHTTLWNWERKGYLIPVKIGRKVSYRQADIERIIIERGSR